ncbi:MAG: TlpA disulfide reductase family protein [Gammaproteobacteria bacterium]
MSTNLKTLLLCLVIFGCTRPDIELHDSRDIFYQDTLGSFVIINYWADWCAPCIKEIPQLASFAKANKDKLVFAFNYDRVEGRELTQLVNKFGIDYPSLISHPNNFWDIPSPQTLPATFIINKNGELIKSFLQPVSKEDLEFYFLETK